MKNVNTLQCAQTCTAFRVPCQATRKFRRGRFEAVTPSLELRPPIQEVEKVNTIHNRLVIGIAVCWVALIACGCHSEPSPAQMKADQANARAITEAQIKAMGGHIPADTTPPPTNPR